MPSQIAPILVWIPKNPAERAVALSAEIISSWPQSAEPWLAFPNQIGPVRVVPHLDLHRKDASSEPPMLGSPVA